MKPLFAFAVALTALAAPAVWACDHDSNQASILEPKQATVAEVIGWTKDRQVTPVDANGNQTRERQGVIPGAVLLTSSSQYDVKELPADKHGKLVFYCMNERCGASHAAARRALEAGYTDVSVLSAGITGWRAAGQPTAKPNI